MSVVSFPNRSSNNQRVSIVKSQVHDDTRKKSVTIIMNDMALLTAEPTEKDHIFFHHVKATHKKWQDDGCPKSGDFR